MTKNKKDFVKFEEDLVKEVKKDFLNRQQARKNIERQWQLNMNFVAGNQYCTLTDVGELEDFSKQYFWQEREVYNHIAPIIETRIAKLSKVRPVFNVAPSGDSEKDIHSAKLSRKILNAVEHNLKLSEKISQATNWSEICGTSFYKVVWNSQKGDLLGYDKDGNGIRNGEVDISVCSPFEIFPDCNTTEKIDDLASIIHAKPYKVSAIKKIWGVDVLPEDIDVLTMSNQNLAGGLGYTASVQKIISEKASDSAIVIERYEAPTTEHPNGRVIVVAGDRLLAIGELPFVNRNEDKRGFPFVKQCSLTDGGSFWGFSVIERLIPVQRSYNAIKNRKHEFLNRIAMGILTVEDGSVDIRNLEEEGLSPGKVLVYRQGSTPPEILSTNDIPSAFEKEEESLLEEFIQISGVSDYNTSANVARSNISGVALELIIERENDRLLATSDQIKFAMIEIGKNILRLYKQFAGQKRLAKIEDEKGKMELFYWNKSDITSDDVVLDTKNELGETLSQRRSMIFDMLNAGLLADENGKLSVSAKQKTLEMLGFGTWENGNDLSNMHIKQAGKENIMFIEGKMPKTLSIDDHSLHIQSHTAFVLSNEFDDNQVLSNLIEHIEEHKAMLKAQMQEELMQEKTANK
ncbi:MAG: hypothetical protein ACI4TZ_04185 [Christensenellales bacterium]